MFDMDDFLKNNVPGYSAGVPDESVEKPDDASIGLEIMCTWYNTVHAKTQNKEFAQKLVLLIVEHTLLTDRLKSLPKAI
jgi:hypothetical protein